MEHVVLTVVGRDRPGLVAALSAPVEAHGGSWQRSQMARLAGHFAGVVEVGVPDHAVAALEADLAALADDGLTVHLTRTAAPEPRATGDGQLHVLGNDRPGILAEVARVLAAHGVGIEELVTETREAPMAGGTLFEVDAVLSVPAGTDEARVRTDLEGLAAELIVELAFGPAAPPVG